MMHKGFTVFLFLLLLAVTARAEILIVGQNGRFSTVGSAIEAARAGETIRIEKGIYTENLVLDKTLTLEGVDKPVIRGTGKGSVIVVASDNCRIAGLRVENSGGDLQAEDAGILLKSAGNTVEENELKDVLFGIYLFHASGNLIRGNRIKGRPELESGARGAGLHLWNSPDNVLEDNVISEARDGMYIQSSANNSIRRNRVSNLRYGLHFMNSDSNLFEDNLFFDNVAGAAIMYSQKIELRRNAFLHNRGFSSFGILFQDCRECLTEENLILDNATGIFLEAVKNSVFRRNTIAENDVALQIFSSSDDTLFTQNNFIDNLSPLQLIGKSSSTRWQTADEGGNYWSDYDGYDLDADGRGDQPHKIQNVFEYLEGNFPRLRIYLNSPAAESIAAAEKSFPIMKGSKEIDRSPLMRPVKIESKFERLNESRGAARLLMLTGSAMMLGFSAVMIRRGFYRK
jgi:nitrous oxidase accessory protein